MLSHLAAGAYLECVNVLMVMGLMKSAGEVKSGGDSREAAGEVTEECDCKRTPERGHQECDCERPSVKEKHSRRYL